jgi:hypothetical protein
LCGTWLAPSLALSRLAPPAGCVAFGWAALAAHRIGDCTAALEEVPKAESPFACLRRRRAWRNNAAASPREPPLLEACSIARKAQAQAQMQAARSHRRLKRCFRSSAAAWPTEIVCSPLGAGMGSPRINTRTATGSGVCGRDGAHGTQEFISTTSSDSQRHNRSREWRCDGTALPPAGSADGSAAGRETTGTDPVAETAQDFAFHIVRKLARARLGEIKAVGRAQTPNLPFEIRPLRGKAPPSSTNPSQTSM